MNAKLFLQFIFLIFLCSNSFAQEAFDDIIEEIIPKTRLDNDQLKHLREELKIQKMFIEGAKEIEIRGGQFVNIEKSTNTVHDLIKNSIGAKTIGLQNEVVSQVEDVVKSAINRNGIKNTLIKAKDMAYGFGNSRKVMMTSIARRFGFDIGIVYLATLQVDVTFPLIMIANGQPQFAALLATPVSSMATGTFAAIKSAVKFRQIVKMLGGVKNTIAHYKIFQEVRKFFNDNIILKHDLIDFSFGNRTFVATVERQNMISKFLNKIGVNKQLNLQSLMDLLDEKGMLEDITANIRRSKRPDQVKFLRLMNKIQQLGDEKILIAIQERFGKYINEVSNFPDFSRQRNWAVKVAHSKNFDDFVMRMAQMPDDIPPKVFDRMWRNYILQTSSKTIGPYMSKRTLNAFREMYNNYDKIFRKDFMTSVDTKISIDLKARFTDYLFDSLKGVGICGQFFKPRRGTTPRPLLF